ncbi:MAG TPA: hemolysin family protein [Kofleriaceae bacterium]|nr:hemolysin family protein [Kofleriaceae bacterium]
MTPVIATGTLVTAAVIAIAVQGLFVSTELALGACDRARLRQRAQAGGLGARLAERMVARQTTTAATVALGAHLASLVLAALAALCLLQREHSPLWAPLLVTPPVLVLGHLLPRAVVPGLADRLAPLLALVVAPIGYLLRPLVIVLSGVAGATARVFGTDKKRAFITRDELTLLIESDPTTDKPGITADEREMIANVFELSEYTVGDLMVPLSEVTALPDDTTLAEAAIEVADKQHSRMPVYKSRVDDIVGIVHAFDLLAAGPEGKQRPVSEIAHGANYVPGSMKAIDLLVQLQAAGNPMAIVVDEYGGAVGVVTIEDLLETIVGDIEDEYDDEPLPIRQERPNVWRVEAKTSVVKLNQSLDLGLPESDDYETVAGLLIERFRRIPAPGATLQVGGALIEVVAATDRAISAVRISKRRR